MSSTPAQNTFKDFPTVDANWLSASYLVVSQISGDTHKSFKIKTTDLMAQLLAGYSTNSSIKSMAYENARDYAKISHDHDIYTSAYARPNMSIVDKEPLLTLHDFTHGQSQSLSIEQHLSVDNDILRNVVTKIYDLQPYIGEMRMQSQSSFSGIDKASFDGWVPATGDEYFLSDFYEILDLSIVFAASQEQKFVVPNAYGFFKLGTSLSCNVNYMTTGKTCLANHSHEIVGNAHDRTTDFHIRCVISNDNEHINVGVRSNGPLQGTNKILVTPWGSGSASHGNHAHYGTGTVKPQSTMCITTLDKNTFVNSGITTLSALADGVVQEESYPSYNSLSAFVYVGRSISSSNLHDPMPYFDISFDPNGGYFVETGSTSISTLQLKAGEPFALEMPIVKSDERQFLYWRQISPVDAPIDILPRKLPIGDRVFAAQWGELLRFEVTFYDYNFSTDSYEQIGDTQYVMYGDNAIPPFSQADDQENHTFNGWYPSYQNVKSNLDIYAQYDATSQLVTEKHESCVIAEDGKGFSLGRP